jgi:hypothetical protein
MNVGTLSTEQQYKLTHKGKIYVIYYYLLADGSVDVEVCRLPWGLFIPILKNFENLREACLRVTIYTDLWEVEESFYSPRSYSLGR